MSGLDTAGINSKEHLYIIENFEFQSGQILPAVCINYITLGTPDSGSDGHIQNAILLIHGTASSWKTYTETWWSSNMYGPGQPLDLCKYFIVISDNIGSGGSSKPSDGLRMNFPSYQHNDIVKAQHELITNHLGIKQLRAVIGSSLGGRLTWQWTIQYPNAVKSVIPMIASPFPLAGRRGMQDYLGIEPLLIDPSWDGGNYIEPPRNFPLAIMAYWIFMSGVNHLWKAAPTRERSMAHLPKLAEKISVKLDANDWIYQLRANNNFNASLSLELIQAKVLSISIDGDEMVPVELGQLEETKRTLGNKMEIILAKDSGRGHAALQHVIKACAPEIDKFLNSLA